MSEWKECPKCHCMNLNREMCQDCWRDLKDVAAEQPLPPLTAEAKPDCAPLELLGIRSMDDGRNVKCPRCWHWHGVIENFGHEPGIVLPDGRNTDKEKLCDRCQQIIIADYPNHPSVPHIKAALEAQRAKYARMPNDPSSGAAADSTVAGTENFMTKIKAKDRKGAAAVAVPRVVSRRRKSKLKLYEISALVDYHSVILAASEKDALEHVATWEQAWNENADIIAVSDVQITDIRPLKSSDWKDEAHDRTCKAARTLKL